MLETQWWVAPASGMLVWVVAAAALLGLAALLFAGVCWKSERTRTVVGVVGVAASFAFFVLGVLGVVQEGEYRRAAAEQSTDNLAVLLEAKYGAEIVNPDYVADELYVNRPDQVPTVMLRLPDAGLRECVVLTPAQAEQVAATCGGVEPPVVAE